MAIESTSGAVSTERIRVADRLERAIDERADVEQEIERGEPQQPRRSVRRTVFWLALTGISLYLVAPSVLEVAGSWNNLDELAPWWFAVMAALQAASLVSLWELQRLAIHVRPWRPVIASQLAGNALSKVAPGGGAMGAALQYKMLVQAGIDRARAVAGLTAASLLVFAVVLALPVLAVPAIVRGVVPRTLTEATLAGLGAIRGAVRTRRPAAGARWCACMGGANGAARPQQAAARLASPDAACRSGCCASATASWRRSARAGSARSRRPSGGGRSTTRRCSPRSRPSGPHPRWSLVLLAFCAAQLLAQIPVTPGGLGFVEAGLTATLALAGVGAGDAVLATFAYRLFTYWLPLPLGLLGAVLHRRRYGTAGSCF